MSTSGKASEKQVDTVEGVSLKWSRRFGFVALLNTLIAILWVIMPIFVDQRISRTIAGGSAGTWGYLGFLLFITIGFAGFAGFAFLYYIIPQASMKEPSNILSGLHLILMEIGTVGVSALLGLAGYIGGITILNETAKGTAAREIPGIVHGRIAFVVEPIPTVAIFAGLAGLGVLLGVVSLLLTYRVKKN